MPWIWRRWWRERFPGEDWASFKRLAEVMKESAARLEIPLEWGGDWTTLKDGPHFQLPRGWRGKA